MLGTLAKVFFWVCETFLFAKVSRKWTLWIYIYMYVYIYTHTDGWKSSHRRLHNRIHGIPHPSQRSITGVSLSSSIEAHCRDLERLGYPSPCPVEQLLVEVAAPPSSSTLAATPTPEATSTVTRQLPKMRPAVCCLHFVFFTIWTSTCWVPASYIGGFSMEWAFVNISHVTL